MIVAVAVPGVHPPFARSAIREKSVAEGRKPGVGGREQLRLSDTTLLEPLSNRRLVDSCGLPKITRTKINFHRLVFDPNVQVRRSDAHVRVPSGVPHFGERSAASKRMAVKVWRPWWVVSVRRRSAPSARQAVRNRFRRVWRDSGVPSRFPAGRQQ